MTFADIINDVDSDEQTLAVFNREEHEPVVRLLEQVFDSEHVEVREAGNEPAGPANVVQLQNQDGVAIAASRLDEIRDHLLLVNSDLYITGTRPLDHVTSSNVVANLDETTFTVAGKSKFLLIHISRQVEAMALETGDGVLHSGFQRLARIRDERGTHVAYRRLADTDVDVHVYGIPDWEESPSEEMVVHAHEDGEIPQSWFVVHDGNGDDRRKAALVAVEVGPNEYEGFWTFRADLVDEIVEYIEETYVD
jgi:DICT domain-containing protein